MTLSVVSTPLDSAQNSYVTVAEADAYVSDIVMSSSVQDAWSDLDSGQKGKYLVNATRLLDSMVDWVGDLYSRDQKLKWPRSNVYIENYLLDPVITPDRVKWATIEMALWLMGNGGETKASTNFALDKVSVGSIRIDFNESAGGSGDLYIPDNVVTLIDTYGSVHNPEKPGAMQVRTVRLIRA